MKPRGRAGDETQYFSSMAVKIEKNILYFQLARFVYAVVREEETQWVARSGLVEQKEGTKDGRLYNSRGTLPTAASVQTSSLSPLPSPILVATLLSSLSSSTSWRTSAEIVSENTHVFYSDPTGSEPTSQPKHVFQQTSSEPPDTRSPDLTLVRVSFFTVSSRPHRR